MMKTIGKLKVEKTEINKNNKNLLLQVIHELEEEKPKDPWLWFIPLERFP